MQIRSNSTRSFPCKCLQMHNQAQRIKTMQLCLVCYTEQGRSVCSERFWAPSGRQMPSFATDCIFFPEEFGEKP